MAAAMPDAAHERHPITIIHPHHRRSMDRRTILVVPENGRLQGIAKEKKP
jgi:hypothetical protein